MNGKFYSLTQRLSGTLQHLRYNIKIAVEANRQEKKHKKTTKNPKIFNKYFKNDNLLFFKMMPQIKYFLQKTPSETQSTAVNKNSKKSINKRQMSRRNANNFSMEPKI